MTKRILITGVTGFVGSHLADLLTSQEDTILFGAKRTNSRLRNISHVKDKINLLDCDLTDYSSLRHVLLESKPDQIYHLGALSWVTPSWDMPAAYMQTNAIGTINLFEALRHLDMSPRILVSCTPEEFGDVPEELIPITEETRVAPVNHYAASKAAQDAVCQSYFASYNLPIIRTRAFNHEGPRRDISGALASFAYQIARIEAGKQEPVIKVGNLDAKRNFTDVRDMAKAYHLAMEQCTPGELYLIGTDQIYTIKECLEMLISLSTADSITYETDPKRVRPTELNILVGDCSIAR
jgi:GDP-4-dehydro-6-deoxy-D-mannose reductase